MRRGSSWPKVGRIVCAPGAAVPGCRFHCPHLGSALRLWVLKHKRVVFAIWKPETDVCLPASSETLSMHACYLCVHELFYPASRGKPARRIHDLYYIHILMSGKVVLCRCIQRQN